jgi:nuclear cap-binding protein subunit 1
MDSARASIEAVRTWARANPELAASSLPASTEAPTTQPEIEDALARDITLQAILLLGSKSISHVLNALERSLPVLRDLFPDHRYASDPAAVKAMRQGLRAAWDVNQMSEQMGEIVVDKLLNYRVVDAGVVCGWVLERAEEGGFAE